MEVAGGVTQPEGVPPRAHFNRFAQAMACTSSLLLSLEEVFRVCLFGWLVLLCFVLGTGSPIALRMASDSLCS